MDNPAYYLRFCKTFHRMGGGLYRLLCLDNRAFLVGLLQLIGGMIGQGCWGLCRVGESAYNKFRHGYRP